MLFIFYCKVHRSSPSTIGADARAPGLEREVMLLGGVIFLWKAAGMDWVGCTFLCAGKDVGMYTMDASVWISINTDSFYHHLLSVCAELRYSSDAAFSSCKRFNRRGFWLAQAADGHSRQVSSLRCNNIMYGRSRYPGRRLTDFHRCLAWCLMHQQIRGSRGTGGCSGSSA